MSSNVAARRAPITRTRSIADATTSSSSAAIAAKNAAADAVTTDADPINGTRKRAALTEMTNAARTRAAQPMVRSGADLKGKAVARTANGTVSGATAGVKRTSRALATINGRGDAGNVDEGKPAKAGTSKAAAVRTRVPAAAPTRTTATVKTTATAASRIAATRVAAAAASRSRAAAVAANGREHETDDAHAGVDARASKRPKVEEDAKPTVEARSLPAKDEGWEDLDAEDADDPLMVAEYVNEIFHYMMSIENNYLPNGDYMLSQREIDWSMRSVLVDWLIDIHAKFRLLPETLFLTINIVDRFLSQRCISLGKLQLVGLTAMFIAAKYEEVLCPSVGNFLFIAEGGYTDEEILRAERYMLKILGFNLSYANPMNFLRRISKADNYDIQTRTVAKYFMEMSLVDHRLLEHPPSLVAAASFWMARKVLERGPWNATLVHYSTYSVEELLPTAEIMMDYILRPSYHQAFFKKYSGKKFMRAATYVREWASSNFPDAVLSPDQISVGDNVDALRLDLFHEENRTRPSRPIVGPGSSGSARSSKQGSAEPSSQQPKRADANTQVQDCSAGFVDVTNRQRDEDDDDEDVYDEDDDAVEEEY